MFYSVPPAVASVSSAAHIVGTVNTLVIAAPGVGNTIRLVGLHVKINRNSGAAIVDENISGGVQVASVCLSLAGVSAIDINIPPPGIQLGNNQALNLASVSTVAAGLSTITAYYFIDNIS